MRRPSAEIEEEDIELKVFPPPAKIPRKDSNIVPKCSTHADNDCTFWCNECSKPICLNCVNENHQEHSFLLLKKALREKVKDALDKIYHLKDNIRFVNSNITQCSSEVAFLNSMLEVLRKRKQECEEIRDIPVNFELNMVGLKRFAEGKDDHNLDGQVLDKLFQLYQKTDEDLFFVKYSFLKVFHGTFSSAVSGKSRASKREYFESRIGTGKFLFTLKGTHKEGTHKIRLACDTTKMTAESIKWPVIVNFKYSVLSDNEANMSASNGSCATTSSKDASNGECSSSKQKEKEKERPNHNVHTFCGLSFEQNTSETYLPFVYDIHTKVFIVFEMCVVNEDFNLGLN